MVELLDLTSIEIENKAREKSKNVIIDILEKANKDGLIPVEVISKIAINIIKAEEEKRINKDSDEKVKLELLKSLTDEYAQHNVDKIINKESIKRLIEYLESSGENNHIISDKIELTKLLHIMVNKIVNLEKEIKISKA